MIVSALADYYDQLCRERPGEVAEPGWSKIKISHLLVISEKGELLNIIPAPDKHGWTKRVPERVKRSSGIAPNLLADTSSYLLGIDGKDNPERAKRCFEAAKEAHLETFSSVDSDAARAVCAFFESWDPDSAMEDENVQREEGGLLAGGNLSFVLEGEDVADDEAISAAWNARHRSASDEDVVMRCLDTGEFEPVARLHPSVKGVYGGQSSGSSLVSFNSAAFESYGHEGGQGLNAPVSKDGAFKYTTALNFLMQSDTHHVRIGDTTVVYWADCNDEACTSLMSLMLGNLPPKAKEESGGNKAVDESIGTVMRALSRGRLADVEGLDPDATFYVLGIAPNAARLSIRFFVRNSFGAMLENVRHHYERTAIVHFGQLRDYLTPYQLVSAADNPKAKNPVITSELGGALLQSILTDTAYPESLYENMLLRIRATSDDKDKGTQKVTYARAAFIKAYLIKNAKLYQEGTMETLNTERDEIAYSLGRLFWTLEDLQHSVNPNVNTTINDKYFNAAVATPSRVFPSLLTTAQDHLNKLARTKPNWAYAYDEKIRSEMENIYTFPKTLSNSAQGDFIVGYYHQKNADIQERGRLKQGKEASDVAVEGDGAFEAEVDNN